MAQAVALTGGLQVPRQEACRALRARLPTPDPLVSWLEPGWACVGRPLAGAPGRRAASTQLDPERGTGGSLHGRDAARTRLPGGRVLIPSARRWWTRSTVIQALSPGASYWHPGDGRRARFAGCSVMQKTMQSDCIDSAWVSAWKNERIIDRQRGDSASRLGEIRRRYNELRANAVNADCMQTAFSASRPPNAVCSPHPIGAEHSAWPTQEGLR